jgi:hypothetical protein
MSRSSTGMTLTVLSLPVVILLHFSITTSLPYACQAWTDHVGAFEMGKRLLTVSLAKSRHSAENFWKITSSLFIYYINNSFCKKCAKNRGAPACVVNCIFYFFFCYQ